MDGADANIYQVYVKLLDGLSKAFNFPVPTIPVSTLKTQIEAVTSIPPELQLISRLSRIIGDHETIDLTLNYQRKVRETLSDDLEARTYPSPVFGSSYCVSHPLFLELSSRLRGGKGGFGSLLRGAATKGGQKTSNFDACRDMSGRRLRHVNAEKKLEEWRAEAEERKLEKMADDYIKKKVKEAVKNGKSSAGSGVEKYVEKYRKDSVKCMEEVEKSVREAVKGLKRERGEGDKKTDSDAKRLKIWLGKRKLGESDSEDDSDEEKGDEEKSVVIDSASLSDSGKESETTQDSTVIGEVDAASMCPQASSASGSDEEDIAGAESFKGDSVAPVSATIEEKNSNNGSDATMVHESQSMDTGNTVGKLKEEHPSPLTEPVQEEPVSAGVESKDLNNKPLNFDDIHSVADLEVLGMERLKTELQARGLKCGGTLQERAARLFLLKTTPLEKLPKKLFAKK